MRRGSEDFFHLRRDISFSSGTTYHKTIFTKHSRRSFEIIHPRCKLSGTVNTTCKEPMTRRGHSLTWENNKLQSLLPGPSPSHIERHLRVWAFYSLQACYAFSSLLAHYSLQYDKVRYWKWLFMENYLDCNILRAIETAEIVAEALPNTPVLPVWLRFGSFFLESFFKVNYIFSRRTQFWERVRPSDQSQMYQFLRKVW